MTVRKLPSTKYPPKDGRPVWKELTEDRWIYWVHRCNRGEVRPLTQDDFWGNQWHAMLVVYTKRHAPIPASVHDTLQAAKDWVELRVLENELGG